MGIPPTNKPVEINVIDIHRVVDGKIIEHWAVADMLDLMQHLREKLNSSRLLLKKAPRVIKNSYYAIKQKGG